jgi:hypothetical protein
MSDLSPSVLTPGSASSLTYQLLLMGFFLIVMPINVALLMNYYFRRNELRKPRQIVPPTSSFKKPIRSHKFRVIEGGKHIKKL